VRIVPLGVSDSRLNEREGLTDERGELLVEGLSPGGYAPQACFGGSTRARVEAQRESAAVIAIPPGTHVQGLVVDGDESPVAGAEIWLSYDSFRLIGSVVAASGADGRFALRSVDCAEARWIGARGAGFAPSPSARLEGRPGASVDLRLELGAASGSLRGRVTSSAGEPLQHALVVVGADTPRELRLRDGRRAMAPPPIRARTDAKGEFGVACAPAELVPLLVRAPGFSPWRGEVDVPDHGQCDVAVVLEPGISLAGTVTSSAGTPVADAEVRVGGWDDPAGSLARSGSDGSYRIDSLPAAGFEVTATSRACGKAFARLTGQPGALLCWDPVLVPGGEIRIRIVDERGAALAGWTVEVGATVDGEWLSRWGPSDEDGRFVARNCPQASYMLRVSEPGASFAALQREGLSPGPKELFVRIDGGLRAQGSISGSLVDFEDAPVAGASVRASRADDAAPRTLQSEPGTGRFEFERVPPGEYTLWIRAPGLPALPLGPRRIEPGESWELGELRFERPGTLVLRLRRDDGAPVGRPGLHCRKLDSAAFDELVPDAAGVARSAPLAPGRYRLYVHGEGLVSDTRDVEIAAGRETLLELAIRAGVHVRLVFLDPPEAPPLFDALHFRMLGEQGEVAAEVDLTRRPGTAFQWHVGLPAGNYRVEASDARGAAHAEAPVVLRASAGGLQSLEIRLH
jgi:hypothetical protein